MIRPEERVTAGGDGGGDESDGEEVAESGAGGDQHGIKYDGKQEGGSQVRFNEDQPHRQEHEHEGYKESRKTANVLVQSQIPAYGEHEGDLGEFTGLKINSAGQGKPAVAAVDRTGVEDGGQEQQGAEQDQVGKPADVAVGRGDYFAALASAGERVLSYARYDQRHGRELRPARVLLESVEALAADGHRVSVAELRDGPPQALGDGRFQFVASFADAVNTALPPAVIVDGEVEGRVAAKELVARLERL